MAKSWRDKFKTNYEGYPQEILDFVEWYFKEMSADDEIRTVEPLLVNFGYNLAVFLKHCDGDINRIDELIHAKPKKPIIEEKK